MDRSDLKRYAWISIAAALVTIALKATAYVLTGSVGLLSDALESVVNLLAAIVALIALSVAARPADEEHTYGHYKAEYFSSGFEGALIVVAALSIGVTAVLRLLNPQPLTSIGIGTLVAAVATVINLGVARLLARVGYEHGSITLEADARHLMADVLTSAGAIAGVFTATLTGRDWIDPVVGMLIAAHILWAGLSLVRRSMLGLMDTALPESAQRVVREILASHERGGVQFHALRSRQAGARQFISFHVLVPGNWTVQQGHNLLEEIEEQIHAELPTSTIFTHLEPIEDPASFEDTQLERRRTARPGD